MLKIRKANAKDSHFIWKWRNNKESRVNFKASSVVTKKRHNLWYKTLLEDKKNYVFIGEYNYKQFGIIRYSPKNECEFIVSINMNPEFRNKGYGKKLLILGDKEISTKIKKNIKLVAEVKTDNIKSNRIFKNAGYKLIDKEQNYNIFNKLIRGNMKKKSKNSYEKYLKIIDDIQNIRSKNNINWMNLLRIAFKYDPKEASKVMSKIYKDDKKISNLAKKLTQLK